MFNNLIAKAVLKHLTDGDTGSTWLGTLASALLVSNVNFADLASKDKVKQSEAIGLLVATLVTFVWGWFTGKNKIK